MVCSGWIGRSVSVSASVADGWGVGQPAQEQQPIDHLVLVVDGESIAQLLVLVVVAREWSRVGSNDV